MDDLDVKGNPLTPKAMYLSKVGVRWKSIIPYNHLDPYRWQNIGNGMRGKTKTLVTKDIEFIVEVFARSDR